MKQLTQEVFDLPDCPDWAESANVDISGSAYYWESDAETINSLFLSSWPQPYRKRIKKIGDGFNPEGYATSAINRINK